MRRDGIIIRVMCMGLFRARVRMHMSYRLETHGTSRLFCAIRTT